MYFMKVLFQYVYLCGFTIPWTLPGTGQMAFYLHCRVSGFQDYGIYVLLTIRSEDYTCSEVAKLAKLRPTLSLVIDSLPGLKTINSIL